MAEESTGSFVRRGFAMVFWAATWGIGAAIGVALGGWLTVASGTGAPGVVALDITQDVVVLPVLAGIAVFLLHLGGQAVLAARKRRRSM